MKKIVIISIILIIILSFGTIFLLKTNKKRLRNNDNYITRTYEQGLLDGFGKTMFYLNKHKYLRKDTTFNIELIELDSILSNK
jgi:hypothetical protein